MPMKRRPRIGGDIDVNAFADIAFLLIIFFILTTTFSNLFGREMQIPTGSKPEDASEQEPVRTVNLSVREIRYGEDENAPALSLAELRDRLFEEDFPSKTRDMERMVIVESARDVPYSVYFQVLTAIGHAGGIVALVEDDEE